MKDSTIAWIVILITLSVTIYCFHMVSVKQRNFNNIPQTYEDISIDTTRCLEKLKGERKFKWNK